jgi:hypothetical protein
MRWLLFLALPVFATDSVSIFNRRDLSGWIHEGDRFTFGVRDGVLFTSGTGYQPNWLHTAREYENFRLEFDYTLSQWAEAAVYIRAPRLGRQATSGIAITLAHDYHNGITPYTTGGIAGALPPRNPKAFGWNEWQHVEIAAEGDRLTVHIDGVEKQNVNLASTEALKWRLKRGFIGFPDLGFAYQVRNLRIQDLGSTVAYTLLGANLDGWELRGGGNWSAHDGIVTGANGDGILYAPGVWQNFEFTTLVRSHHHVNSGVFLHGSPDLKQTRGFEIQIYNVPDAIYPTASIYNIARSRVAADYDEQWFLLQVVVDGRRCEVRVNGQRVAETDALPDPAMAAGRIGLQIHSPDSSVEFRDMRVRALL